MRPRFSRFLSLALIVFLPLSCQKKEEAPTVISAPVQVPGQMSALLSESLATVTAVKDGNIPVKGSLNLREGLLKKNVDGSWQSQVVLDLKTWNTGLTLRDQRVRDLFFEVAKPGFDTAQLTLEPISGEIVDNALTGAEQSLDVQGQLAFAGQTQNIRLSLKVTAESGHLIVKSAAPVTIGISEWGLDTNKMALMQVCGHREIQNQVTVTFVAKFE